MSYSFQVRKTGGSLELVDTGYLSQVAEHVPDGAVFTVNGHTPSPDSSKIGAVHVQLTTLIGETATFLASAQASYNSETES